MTHTAPNAAPLRVLMMGLGDEIFAIEAGMVREIIDPVPTTRVAGAKPHLPGVVNVRGNVIPLADIRVRFGMERGPATPDTRIVVMEVEIDGEPVVVGVIADKVHDVTEIMPSDCQEAPRIGLHWRPDFVRFIARWNDEFIVVPEMNRILN
ncbi:MAG: chemotaxis protein CheW [Janthinobacterium lividum]